MTTWFNTIRTLYLAFYSPHVYVRAAREWRGIGFGYLFCLILISTACIGIWVHTWTNVAIAQIEKVLLPQLPKMTFQDGKLAIDKELPYVIRINDVPVARFDKTDELPAEPSEFSPLVLGETKASQYIKRTGKVKEWIYDKVLSTVIDPLGVARYVQFLKTWLGVIVAAIILPIHFAIVATQTLLLGVIGRVFTSTMSMHLTYSRLVRIAVVAVTPGVVLGTILLVANQFFQLWLGIYGIMAAGYMFFGVYSNKHADDHIFEGSPMNDGYPESTEFEC